MFPAMSIKVVRRDPPRLRGTAADGWAAFRDLAFGLNGAVTGLPAGRLDDGVVFLSGSNKASLGLALVALVGRRDPDLSGQAPRRPPAFRPGA